MATWENAKPWSFLISRGDWDDYYKYSTPHQINRIFNDSENIIKYKSFLRINQLSIGSVGISCSTLTLSKVLPFPESQAQLLGKWRHCVTASLNVLLVSLSNVNKASRIFKQKQDYSAPSFYLYMLNMWPCVGRDFKSHRQIKTTELTVLWWGKESYLKKISPPPALAHMRFLERQLPQHIRWLQEWQLCTRIPRGTMQFLTHPMSSQKRTQEAVTGTKVTCWFLCPRQGVCSPSSWSGWVPSSPEMAAWDGPGVLSGEWASPCRL